MTKIFRPIAATVASSLVRDQKTSYQKPQPTFVPYPTPLTPEEVLGTGLDNDPKRLKVPAYYNEVVFVSPFAKVKRLWWMELTTGTTSRTTRGFTLSSTTRIKVLHSSGTHPSPRDSHSSMAVGSKLYVFGGTDGTSPLNHTLCFGYCYQHFGDVSAPREGHSTSLIGDNLFMFGGSGKSSDPSEEEYYNDLHVLNMNTFVWKKISTTGASPISRDSHTCSSYKNCFVVMGDADGGNPETMAWRERLVFGRLRIPLVPGLLHVSPLQEILWTQSWLLLLLTLLPFLTIWLPFFCEEMLREKDPSEPKLSMRKELKRRWQEYRATPFMLDKQRDVDKSLVSSHGEFQAHVQPLGEKMFEAREETTGRPKDRSKGQTEQRESEETMHCAHRLHFASIAKPYIFVQPEQLLDDAYYAVKKLAWLGSDWPVVAVNPVGGIRTAMERTPSGWSHPWIPKERISAWDTVAGYTSSAVYAAALEDLVGSLMQGKFADFVVLSESPFGQGTGIFPRVHICKKIGEEKAARIIKQLDLKLDNILSKLKKEMRESGDQHL
ncbi:hypothetical protein SELMODRAFT_431096 [Selaginella moellendorffii]|uniref:Uncharacterized protein n=1 Tax=Selaginella moellendorffii TaxID=88036 RepID=D8TBI2_SELML|nr:hypothetical protein SELMODRAFT_431096 [Selaginella moellendorffii]